jgi:hypothetical protein
MKLWEAIMFVASWSEVTVTWGSKSITASDETIVFLWVMSLKSDIIPGNLTSELYYSPHIFSSSIILCVYIHDYNMYNQNVFPYPLSLDIHQQNGCQRKSSS